MHGWIVLPLEEERAALPSDPLMILLICLEGITIDRYVYENSVRPTRFIIARLSPNHLTDEGGKGVGCIEPI